MGMPHIRELLDLARQCYAQANGTTNPEAKQGLQDMGAEYAQKAMTFRSEGTTPAVFPSDSRLYLER